MLVSPTEPSEFNCMQGYRVYNRHNNCPYSLMCAVCDLEDDEDVDKPDRA